MYQLMYVRGIGEIDTPIFSTRAEQLQYFNPLVVKTIDAYFPPHYTNVIKLTDEDINFNTKVNYLKLEHRGRWYFYFIDSVEYINENIISISIRMDTIQTYMFDIEYTNARVSRKTINRYIADDKYDTIINRNYIRENFGNQIYRNKTFKDIINYFNKNLTLTEELKSKEKIESDKTNEFFGWYAFKFIKKPSFLTPYDMTIISGKVTTNDGSFIVLYPALVGDIDFTAVNDRAFTNILLKDYNDIGKEDSGTLIQYSEWLKGLRKLQSDSGLIEAYYIPFNILFPYIQYRIIYQGQYTEIYIYLDDSTNNIGKADIGDGAYGIALNQVITDMIHDIKRDDLSSYCTKPKLGDKFSVNFIPQLLDSSYIQVKLGEINDEIEYPLELMTRNDGILELAIGYDIMSGNRVYNIGDRNADIYDDVYSLRKISSETFNVLMVNDAWTNYYQGHRGSVVISNAISPLMNMASLGISIGGMRGKNFASSTGRLYKKGQRALSGGVNIANEAIDNASQLIDIANTPHTAKVTGSTPLNVWAGLSQIIFSIKEVTNIEAVATIYESIGYKVDEFVNGSPISNNRSIYNYVECSDIDLHLNILSTDEQLRDIERRYLQGIRYWNVDNMNKLNLHLGEVCVYDNTERSYANE